MEFSEIFKIPFYSDLSARMEVRLPPDTEIIKYTSSMSDKSNSSGYSEDLSRKRLKLDPEVSISAQSSSMDDRHKSSNEGKSKL